MWRTFSRFILEGTQDLFHDSAFRGVRAVVSANDQAFFTGGIFGRGGEGLKNGILRLKV